jgi:hypothetical protein
LWHTHARLSPSASAARLATSAGAFLVHVLGLPLSSVIVLIVIPLALIAYQYFLCWEIKTGRRE